MGFFAVVDRHEVLAKRLKVKQLDINIWALPGLLGRRILYCDIGLSIEAGRATRSLMVGVLFGSRDDKLIDLVPGMADSRTSSMVFGEAVAIEEGPIARFSTTTHKMVMLEPSKTSRQAGSSAAFTLWEVGLARNVKSGDSAYIRFRVPVRDGGRCWTWRRSALRRRGATVDVRVADLRESVLVRGGPDRSEIVTIDRINCFVIAPHPLRTRRASPDLRYLRVLEGAAWERYLGRATDLRRRRKFTVSYWRAENVNPDHDFRGYLDLSSEVEPVGWRMTSLLFLVFLGSQLLTSSPYARRHSLLADYWDGIVESRLIESGVAVIAWSAVLGGGLFLIRNFKGVARVFAAVREGALGFEQWLYKKRAKL